MTGTTENKNRKNRKKSLVSGLKLLRFKILTPSRVCRDKESVNVSLGENVQLRNNQITQTIRKSFNSVK